MLLGMTLLLVMVLGNAVILMFTMNYLYGCPFPERIMSLVRPIFGGFICVGCLVFTWLFWDYEFDAVAVLAGANPVVSAYVVLCWLMGLVVFPLATLSNRLKRRPAVLLSNHTQTVDVAQELGFKPVGFGKHRWEALLPFNQCFQVDFSERTLQLPNLPAAFDGLKILHLSDLHFCGVPDRSFYLRVVDQIQRWP